FFSSRRRHTRFSRDWSSDVCSSDLNLLTSTIFLIGVGFVYGTAGTVNMGELAGLARDDGAVAMAVALCLFALSIKAAVVPVHGRSEERRVGREWRTRRPRSQQQRTK